MNDTHRQGPLRDAHEDIESIHGAPDTPQTRASAYRLAFSDTEFMERRELRPVRLQLELLKTEMALEEAGIESTVVLFGGARIRESADQAKSPGMAALTRYYGEARAFARAITERSLATGGRQEVIVTGGGPGVMEAGNRGAEEAGGKSIGLSIVLPHEQAPNAYVTPELCFNFHYFAIRKMHFLMRAKALAVFPGGFGTMDEMFETLTLIQTGRMARIPVLLFGREFWETLINFDYLVESGTISADDLQLFRMVETAREAIETMDTWEGAGTKRDVIPGR